MAVVGHGAREAIEYFELQGVGPGVRARWAGCVLLPSAAAGNDLVLELDGSVLVTNYIPSVHGIRAWIWLQVASLGWNTGDVLRWTPTAGWSRLPDSEGSMPNGILRHAGTTYIAYNGSREIVALSADGRRKSLSLADLGSPDNLSLGPDGKILAAVLDPSSPGAWSIVETDLTLERARVVYSHDGSELPSVTSVVFDGLRYQVGSMAGDAVGVLGSPAAAQGAAADER